MLKFAAYGQFVLVLFFGCFFTANPGVNCNPGLKVACLGRGPVSGAGGLRLQRD